MADIKRLHYFNHQMLVEDDFTDEQTYHLVMRRRHNRALHKFGVAEGLNVRKTGDKEVTVDPGAAIDRDGKEIIRGADFVVDLRDGTKYPKNTQVHVVIAYAEEESDQKTFGGVTGATRITEKTRIEAVTTAPAADGSVIRLATFQLDANANVPGNVGDPLAEGRQSAGTVLAPGTIGEAELVDGAVTEPKLADGAVTKAKIARGAVSPESIGALSIKGGKVEGSLGVGGELRAKSGHFSEGVTSTATSIVEVRRGPALIVTAPQGQPALQVQGTAIFSGEKRGFTVDTFVNASGQRLHMGDVVRLKGTKIKRFTGTDNRIPVPEVTLADKDNDRRVIGVVSAEAPPEPGAGDTRVDPEDPTFIEDGGELFVITLGTFAHCKADATEAAIEVGDPLTSSSNPGHAKKAEITDTGTIIGKALEPLKKGAAGSIAIFVNIQ
jgi:hypothetical protein